MGRSGRRARGERESSYAQNVRALNDFYEVNTDPPGAMREDYQSRTADQAHMIMQRPSWPIYALINPFYFQNDYNVSSSVFKETNAVGGTALAVQDERGGVAKFTNDADDDDYYFYESLYEIGLLEANKRCLFRGRFKVADVDQADVFFGLCSRIVAKANLFDNRVDAIGFYMSDGSAALNAEARKNSTPSQDTGLVTLEDDTWVTVAINIDGTNRATIFVDNPNAAQATIETNLPDDEEMCFSFGCRNGQAVANSMSVGTTLLIQDE